MTYQIPGVAWPVHRMDVDQLREKIAILEADVATLQMQMELVNKYLTKILMERKVGDAN
jgi:hypothetical protein